MVQVAFMVLVASACAQSASTPTALGPPALTQGPSHAIGSEPMGTATPGAAASTSSIPDAVAGSVIRVVDGDTIHADVDGVDEKIRIIGMDSPESQKPNTPVECFAKQATKAAQGLLAPGDRITLQRDPTQHKRDRYGRLLAHVFLADGSLFAETMIRHGWAVHDIYQGVPSIYADRLQAAEDAAEAEQAGLWSPTTCNGDPHLSSANP
jgi:micrococcal nuclease